jgi:nucleotidyltransferase/DNA polymerase involved in DNA repair
MGIKNTRHLFNTASHKNDRERLAATTEIPIHRLDELVGLSDLSRAYGVGPVFARMLFDVGIKSIRDLIGYSAEEIIRIYEKSTEKTADFGVAEIQFTLDLAKELNRQDD